ncbi:MAG: limonene-1,2-epoxide hydrolase family protein [Candidatus Binataceae bacterium]
MSVHNDKIENTQSEKIVTGFCQAWASLNLERIMEFFTDDAVYFNIPLKPVSGKEAIRKTIGGLLKGTTWLEFKILASASNRTTVFNERVDSFEANGKRVSLPVAGVFETTEGGKIKAWRDYFDLEMFTKQMR